MRRQKREKQRRAFTRGYRSGLHGKSRDDCPFHDEVCRQSWLNGWRNGREDQWAGLTGTAGVGRDAVV